MHGLNGDGMVLAGMDRRFESGESSLRRPQRAARGRGYGAATPRHSAAGIA